MGLFLFKEIGAPDEMVKAKFKSPSWERFCHSGKHRVTLGGKHRAIIPGKHRATMPGKHDPTIPGKV
jgi:hypothetical protein